jgi:hypothetical protein
VRRCLPQDGRRCCLTSGKSFFFVLSNCANGADIRCAPTPTSLDASLAEVTMHDHHDDNQSAHGHKSKKGYARFAAMIVTSTLIMYGLMYLNTYQWDHVAFSETRAYMALIMGAAMAVIMLGFMTHMLTDWRVNAGIIVGSALLFAEPVAGAQPDDRRGRVLHEGDDPASFDCYSDQ